MQDPAEARHVGALGEPWVLVILYPAGHRHCCGWEAVLSTLYVNRRISARAFKGPRLSQGVGKAQSGWGSCAGMKTGDASQPCDLPSTLRWGHHVPHLMACVWSPNEVYA